MRACVFCKTRYQQGSGITFHKFPTGPLKQLWINNMRFENWSPQVNTQLCSKHFTKDCFLRHVARTTLKIGSVPTLFSDAENKSSAQVTLLDTDGMATATTSVSVVKVEMQRNICNISVDQSNVYVDEPSRTEKKIKIETIIEDCQDQRTNEPTNLLESSSLPIRDTVVTSTPNVGTMIVDQENVKLEPGELDVIENIKLEHRYEETPSACKTISRIQEDIKHDHCYEYTPRSSEKALQRIKKSLKISQSRTKVLSQHVKRLKNSVASLKTIIKDLK